MAVSELTILIVEDSAVQAESLRRVLVSDGYTVIVARNGAEGLAKTKELKPDLIVSDISMPFMSGFELCKQVKSNAETASTPVILLTALSDPTDVISGLECGADNFIVKPYNGAYLLSRIRKILEDREHPGSLETDGGVEVRFSGHSYFITAERKQILDLLMSTYENAILKNAELLKIQDEREVLNRELEQKVLNIQAMNDELTLRRQEAEEARKLAEEATLAKSQFLATMSHELRTPLNSINGFSEVLFDQTYGPLNEKQEKYVTNVLTSGRHLLLLINQILDMARVESGKMSLQLTLIKTKSLILETSRLIEDLARRKNIEIQVDVEPDLPDIEGDDLKFKEILLNLLSNAVKFTQNDREVGIRARAVEDEIEVVIWDSGIGIEAGNLAKVFEGFFRVDSAYSSVTEGTGLGLPLAKKLVELHGGRLSVESPGLGQGTSVRFFLPIVSPRLLGGTDTGPAASQKAASSLS